MSLPDPHDDEPTQATLDLGTVAPAQHQGSSRQRGPVAGPVATSDRYELGERLGTGGTGEVRLARDRVLERDVAVKVLHPRLQRLPASVERLRDEARLVARLEHPGVVPVYDVGELPDGRVFLAMKRVQGQTLDAFWRSRSLRRRVALLVSVAQTIAFAHEHGVVHRDLKPSNVMVGAFGEVLVLDWGLARAADQDVASVAGTLAWMAPEQAGGATVAAPADVWALGALLYLALTDRRIHDHRTVTPNELVALLRAGGPDVVPPRPQQADEELVELAMRALHPASDPRPSALQVVRALEAWIDGSRRREQAVAQVQDALTDFEPARTLLKQADALELQAERAGRALPREASDLDREPIWALRDQAQALRTDHALAHARYVQRLQGALSVHAECSEAHQHLADDYARRHQQAERAGDHQAAAGLLPFLQAHDRSGAWASYLRGVGRISLVTTAPATVELYRYEQHHRRWWPAYVGSLGSTPLLRAELPIGSYRLTLHAPGRVPLDLPFVLERGGEVDLAAHGPLYLPRVEQVGPRSCPVAPGWFQSGTSIPSGHPLPRRTSWCDGFVMQRYPVTNAEWLVFLNDLRATGRAEEARQRVPRDSDGTAVHDETPDGWQLGADSAGHRWKADHPVVRVTWHDARAYAAWRAARDGLPWRLPWELEWVKAARGADYRFYPWGDTIEPGWARTIGTPGPEGPHSIYAYPADTSPYGVRHLAGQATCWLLDAFPGGAALDGDRVAQGETPPPSPGGYRLLRGGAWRLGAGSCRSDQRKASPEVSRSETVGVRLVRPWPVDQS